MYSLIHMVLFDKFWVVFMRPHQIMGYIELWMITYRVTKLIRSFARWTGIWFKGCSIVNLFMRCYWSVKRVQPSWLSISNSIRLYWTISLKTGVLITSLSMNSVRKRILFFPSFGWRLMFYNFHRALLRVVFNYVIIWMVSCLNQMRFQRFEMIISSLVSRGDRRPCRWRLVPIISMAINDHSTKIKI